MSQKKYFALFAVLIAVLAVGVLGTTTNGAFSSANVESSFQKVLAKKSDAQKQRINDNKSEKEVVESYSSLVSPAGPRPVGTINDLGSIPPTTPTSTPTSSTPSVARGYTARACGFDLDGDGIVGEPEDDCNVCDGVTADPDRDGINEDQIYVDAQNGSDSAGIGSPSSPYKTISYALSRADGPSDKAEDIVCFRGTVTTEENIVPRVSGIPGSFTPPLGANQAYNVELPANPTMIIGWDHDNDGQYPPYDTNDIAVLDGAPNKLKRAFTLNNVPAGSPRGVSYIEFAHFTAKDFGSMSVEDGTNGGALGIGFVYVGRAGSATSSHIYFHDLKLENINKGKPKNSNSISFNFFGGDLGLKHFTVSNVDMKNIGGYLARGDFGDTPGKQDGPMRFDRISYLGQGCDNTDPACNKPENRGHAATITGFKLWGYLDGVDITNSFFDAGLPNWKPLLSGPINAVVADGCVNEWNIRNNVFLNFRNPFSAKGAPHWCDSRAVNNISFINNVAIINTDYYTNGPNAVALGVEPDSNTIGSSIDNVIVADNLFSGREGWDQCLYSEAGNEEGYNSGTIRFLRNICDFQGYPSRNGAFRLVKRAAYPLQNFDISKNIIAGASASTTNRAVWFEYTPGGWKSDGNIWGPGWNFRIGSSMYNLSQWRSLTGNDRDSRQCPASVNINSDYTYSVLYDKNCPV